jgi:hypothetical protein
MTADVYTTEGISKMAGLTPKPERTWLEATPIANKYVIYERTDLEGVEGLRLGEPYDLHADMVPKGAKVISAGFYQSFVEWGEYNEKPHLEIRVWGFSESLGVTSRPTDAAIIKQYLTR